MITKAGVAIIKQIDGVWHALLVQQKASKAWGFPKGSKSTIQESWQTCARRELVEETGLFAYIPHDSTPVQIRDTAIYVFTPDATQIRLFHSLIPKDRDEISAVSWKPIMDPTDKQFHSFVAKLFVKLSIQKHVIQPLSLPPKQTIIRMCQRSRWIPSGFFQQRRSTKQFWR